MTDEENEELLKALKGPIKRAVDAAVKEAVESSVKNAFEEALDENHLRIIKRFVDELANMDPKHFAFLRNTRDHAVRKLVDGDSIKEIDVLAHMTNSAWNFRAVKLFFKSYKLVIFGASGWLFMFLNSETGRAILSSILGAVS